MAEYLETELLWPQWLAYLIPALVHAALLIAVSLGSGIGFVWLEQKVSGRIQDRLGPTRVGGHLTTRQSGGALRHRRRSPEQAIGHRVVVAWPVLASRSWHGEWPPPSGRACPSQRAGAALTRHSSHDLIRKAKRMAHQ